MIAMGTRVGIVGCAAALLFTSPALAAQRYADPAGDASDASCPQNDPCDLDTAVEHGSVLDGDEVIVAPGTYAVAELDVAKAITVHGVAGGARPNVNLSSVFGVDVPVAATLRRLRIENAVGSGISLRNPGAVAEQLSVHASAVGANACPVIQGTIRDSFCWASGTNSTALGAGFSGSPITYSVAIRNVTAIANGASGYGINYDMTGAGASFAIDAKSVIADGPSFDIRGSGSLGATTTITLDHSNYDTSLPVGSGTVTIPGSGTNQTAAPQLVDAANGDFHELTGSPTKNAGVTDSSSGAGDIDGEARTQGTAADIGADEFDQIPPETTLDGDPPILTNNQTPTFDFSSSEDASTFECSLMQNGVGYGSCDDGGPGLTGSHSAQGPLADGDWVFAVRATDPSGNADPTPVQFHFTVDATPPHTSVTSGPAEGSTTSDFTPTFAFSSTEVDSVFECKVDSGSFANCASPQTTTPLADGPHTFQVRATDLASNTDPGPVARHFTVDTVAPNTTITSGPGAGSTIADSTPTFRFASDEGGASFECKLDGGAFGACASPRTISKLTDGPHAFAVRAVDAGGNIDPSPTSRSFTVRTVEPDTDPPETSLDSQPKKKTKSRRAKFAFSADEPGSTFECSLDGKDPAPCGSPFAQKVKRKRHTFEVVATDPAGNADPTPAECGWKVKKKR